MDGSAQSSDRLKCHRACDGRHVPPRNPVSEPSGLVIRDGGLHRCERRGRAPLLDKRTDNRCCAPRIVDLGCSGQAVPWRSFAPCGGPGRVGGDGSNKIGAKVPGEKWMVGKWQAHDELPLTSHLTICTLNLGPSCRAPDEADAEDEHAEGQQHSANIGEVD